MKVLLEQLTDSLTLNSIGLYVLGLGFLVRHIYMVFHQNKSKDLVVYDLRSSTLLEKLFSAKFWLIGICFLILASISIFNDLRNATLEKNLEIIQDTLLIAQSPGTVRSKRESVGIMELNIDYTLFEKYNNESIKEWYELSQGLNGLNQSNVPTCIHLYEIYEAAKIYDKLEKLDRMYEEFYNDYWGKDFYNSRRISHSRRQFRALQRRTNAQ